MAITTDRQWQNGIAFNASSDLSSRRTLVASMQVPQKADKVAVIRNSKSSLFVAKQLIVLKRIQQLWKRVCRSFKGQTK